MRSPLLLASFSLRLIEVEAWFLGLQQWLKSFKGKKKRRTATTKIIQSWNNKDCIIHQIERDVPGAIATYRINYFSGYNYLITLDYLPELWSDLQLERQLTDEYSTSFRVRDRTQMQTHRFAVSRLWSSGSFHIFKAWDVDLEGLSANFSIQKRAPRQAVKYVVLSALNIFHDPNLPSSWQFSIEDIDWIFLLRNRIREELSSPQHNLHSVVVQR